ncbi:hypothetical protein SVIOM342S_01924 [Streptomyces violaceorubidus]
MPGGGVVLVAGTEPLPHRGDRVLHRPRPAPVHHEVGAVRPRLQAVQVPCARQGVVPGGVQPEHRLAPRAAGDHGGDRGVREQQPDDQGLQGVVGGLVGRTQRLGDHHQDHPVGVRGHEVRRQRQGAGPGHAGPLGGRQQHGIAAQRQPVGQGHVQSGQGRGGGVAGDQAVDVRGVQPGDLQGPAGRTFPVGLDGLPGRGGAFLDGLRRGYRPEGGDRALRLLFGEPVAGQRLPGGPEVGGPQGAAVAGRDGGLQGKHPAAGPDARTGRDAVDPRRPRRVRVPVAHFRHDLAGLHGVLAVYHGGSAQVCGHDGHLSAGRGKAGEGQGGEGWAPRVLWHGSLDCVAAKSTAVRATSRGASHIEHDGEKGICAVTHATWSGVGCAETAHTPRAVRTADGGARFYRPGR